MSSTPKRKCGSPACKNWARPLRTKCNTCNKRLYRERNPIAHAFDNLRSHARERGKKFTLTIEQFRAFCERTGYHEKKGCGPDSATVDRIESSEGYEAGNIRVLGHLENSIRKDAHATAADYLEAYTAAEDPLAT